MQTVHGLAHWLAIHPVSDLIAIYLLSCSIVAVTPKRLQSEPWYGAALWLMHRISFLAHADQLGTFQWPILARMIIFGTPALPAPTVQVRAVPAAIEPSERDTQPPQGGS